jgi:hypothetical protein
MIIWVMQELIYRRESDAKLPVTMGCTSAASFQECRSRD